MALTNASFLNLSRTKLHTLKALSSPEWVLFLIKICESFLEESVEM